MAADEDAVDGAGNGPDGAGDSTAPPTIYDVARAAGVSIASVSRVLNGQRNPRQETRERVLAAVAELGFVAGRGGAGAERAAQGSRRGDRTQAVAGGHWTRTCSRTRPRACSSRT